MKTAKCPSCEQWKHSPTINTDGLCDNCRGGRQADARKRCRRCGCLPELCKRFCGTKEDSDAESGAVGV